MFRKAISSLVLICSLHVTAQQYDSSLFNSLDFRFIGPDGNRTIAVVGEPGNPMVSYVGAASGGIFKTTDAGISWNPIFDDQDNASIGALALAPSNPQQVWAGTGETFLIRPAHAVGNGIYKSSDGGKSWKHLGLENTFRISKVIVDPTDTNIVYVASLGHAHGPQQERGVYKTTDGGKTWNRILFVDENTGCSDLTIDPQHPGILFAAMWQVEIKTWKLNSGGPGSGIYRTKDGGANWEPLHNGLPGGIAHPVGKTSVDIAYSNPKIVYALFEDKVPGLYKSEDGGDNWKLMQQSHSLAQRAPYYTRVRVSATDPNRVFTICVTIMESKDGAKTFNGNGDYRPGGDNHDMWFDPKIPGRIMDAHDGCLNMSFNGGESWRNINLPVAQMYHVSVDNQVPYYVYGNRQDGYSYRGPSNSLQGSIPLSLWTGVGGCESGFAQPDPSDNSIIWSGCYDGGLDVFDLKTGHARDVRAWPEAGYGWAPADMQYRWHWNYPMLVSKFNHKVYIGSQYVHVTSNRGQSWEIISPDLTTNDKSHQQNSGGINSDNLMTFDGCTLYAIEESPLKEGLIWTGSNDGQVQLTRDAGKSWTNVTPNIKGLPEWGTISCINASHFAEGTAYIAADLHQLGDFNAYIFKTTDYGTTWTKISQSIPASNSSFIHQIKEDPAKQGLLWVGTDNALYFSTDDGGNWNHFKNNLPPAPIYGIAIQENFKDLVLATYGRGIYILDDITGIRNLSKSLIQTPVKLFTLRNAYRFIENSGAHAEQSFVTGQNPPYGASINYYLTAKTTDTVKAFVLDAMGNKIANLTGTGERGINRLWWNLRYDEARLPSLRTRPRGKDWVKLDSTGKRRMVIYDLDIGPGLNPPLVMPGTYTIVLSIGNNEWREKLEVLKDPHSTGTMEDLIKQNTFALQVYGAIKNSLEMIDSLETNRSTLLRMAADMQNKKKKEKLLSLENDMWLLEGRLHDVYQTGARQDAFRNPAKILERLLGISKESIQGGADFAPTEQHQQVFKSLKKQLDKTIMDYHLLIIRLNPELSFLKADSPS
jgi:photosystem II stability/assembly factor-like uncharacterized protein